MRTHQFIKIMFISTLILLLSSCDLITTDPPIINNQDRIPPIITLLGDDTIYLEVNTTYEEFGATCKDDIDANCQITVTNTELNMELPGIYTVYYNATDSSGNKANTVTRTVIVQDLTNPVIKLLGQDVLYLALNDPYIELGLNCSVEGNFECQVTIDSSLVDMTTIGTYTVSYTATDNNLNTSTFNRTIIVEDHDNRVMTVPNSDAIYHIINEPWNYPSFYVPNEGTYNGIRRGTVDPKKLGTYEVFYEVSDELNNTYVLKYIVHVVSSVPVDRDVVVLENIYNTYPKIFSQLVSFDVNRDLILDSSEIADVSALDLSQLTIHNIDFIENYTALEYLDLSYNDLYDIDFASSLPALENLNLDTNKLNSDDINVLTNNTVLKSLNLANNYVQGLMFFDGLTNLESLNLNNNFIYDLSDLGDLPALKHLDVGNNPIYDFLNILAFPQLESLNIDQTDITDISQIGSLGSLQNLTLNKDIEDYYYIDQLDHLIELNIPSLDANLEYSFFFDSLKSSGIEITINSFTSFDTTNPNIILYDTSASIKIGSSFDFSSLNYLAYDADDSYMANGLLESTSITADLDLGKYTITLSITDSEGHVSYIDFELTVTDDFDSGNIVLFIRFSDEATLVAPKTFDYYDSLFNGHSNSLRSYYLEVSNDAYDIDTFFPSTDIIYYTDTHDRGYYQPYEKLTNFNGYTTPSERRNREYELLSNAIYWLDDLGIVDESVVLDYNNDGEVDVVTFLISGAVGNWGNLLWPHQSAFYDSLDMFGEFNLDAPSINGDYIFDYTFQLFGDSIKESEYFNLGVFSHEMFHVISAPDLYHYEPTERIKSVGSWDIMDVTSKTPAHMLLYMKEFYGGWDQDDFSVNNDGTYTLNVSTALEDNLIIIDLGNSNEYLYIEYRKKTGTYEANIPNEGVIIYRVDKDYEGNGNVDGYYSIDGVGLDEVFVFRPFTYDLDLYASFEEYYIISDRDVDNGNLKLDGNAAAGPGTNIPLFYSNGSEIKILITVITENEDSVQLNIDFLD